MVRKEHVRLAGISAVMLATAAAVLAEDFWIAKDAGQWSEAQIRSMVTGSPWAKEAAVSIRGSRGFSLDAPRSPGRGIAGEDSAAPPGPPAGEAGRDPIPTGIIVRWESASAVCDACAHGGMDRYLFSCTSKILYLSDLEKKFTDLSREFYILSMSNYPGTDELRGSDAPQHSPAAIAAMERLSLRIRQAAFLKRAGKATIQPANVLSLPAGQLRLVVLFFPRTDPITLADKDVAFESANGTLEVKSRFNLRKMMYKGRLDL